ncbi:Gfo/Idh/MocA family protein [Lignipirellula cremea]|uniref:Inositol 2-dehydrogenase n=1 Tax=Lignipirellula cremea TaxID=2528010 RepID=A0A518DRV7_9BACT|nr:Gfo/Idh/MocA family oxidoreductase [Lignipirellula cremea]QDU94544.1 Inositol 2-dehydrogenase [Lignipirellula cremea]
MTFLQGTRRNFLQTTGSAAVGLALGAQALPGRASTAANERLSVGFVGAGMRGTELMKVAASICQKFPADLTAVCDLWSYHRQRGVDQVKELTGREPRQFQHLEEMLAWSGLDAVVIATPDHAHAIHLTQCVQAGKHVYCEKPFANVLQEANDAVDAWRNSRCVATVGTQFRSDPRYRAAAELVRTGVLGPIVKVDRTFNAHSPYRWRRPAEIKLLKEADTDWKAWLLNKPDRAFDPQTYLEFRLMPEFSSGVIDQWMSHGIDGVHMLTGAALPRSVVAHGGNYGWKDGRANGDTAHVLLDYPEGFLCSHTTSLVNGFGGRGGVVMGRDAALEFHTNWRLSGEGGALARTLPTRLISEEGSVGDGDPVLHMRNWLECVQQGEQQTHCTPADSYPAAVACIMATQALHSGRRVQFDQATRTIRFG